MNTGTEYWDSVAGVKEFTIPFSMELFFRYAENADASILDLGCGYGRILKELYDNGFRSLSGADVSKKMIELASENVPAASLGIIENGKIPFADSMFDAVVILAVLTCIVSDAGQEKLVSETCRVLKPGGIIYLCDFLLNSDKRNIERYEKYYGEYGIYGVFRAEGAVLRHHSAARIKELTAGFENLYFEESVFRTMNGHSSNGFTYIGKKKS